MANLKLNNVVVVAESGGATTFQSGIFKAADGTAAFTIQIVQVYFLYQPL